MAVVVEHDKRKREILEKSMELFCRDGYEDVTFQKIANACGITRTTLYIYFKNKNEIFNFSIKQASSDLEVKFMEVIKNPSYTSEECLRRVLELAVDVCCANKNLFNVLVPYLSGLKQSGANVEERVRRRTIRINHLYALIIIRGQKEGEFKKFGVKEITDIIFSLLEDAVFKIAILHNDDLQPVKASLNQVVDMLVNR